MGEKETLILRRESPWSARLHAKAAAAGVPLSGTFELTTACNFNCKMCYVHDGSKDKMSASDWISLGKKAKDAGMVYLLLTGGEPFLRKDFSEIYTALSAMGLLISVNTNASLIDDSLFELLLKHPPIRMNISLYAVGDSAYAALCGVSAFEKVARNIKRLKAAGITVKLSSSLTPYNKGETEKLYAFAKEVGVPLQATSYMFPPARVPGKKIDRLSPEEAAACLLTCKEQYLTFEELSAMAADTAREEELCVNESEMGEGMNCRGGRSSFWVTSDGRMLPCGMFQTEGFSLFDHSFEEAFEKTRAFASKIRLPRECGGCALRHKCNVCAASCVTESGEFEGKPQYLCQMVKEYLRLLRCKYLNGGEK